MPPLARRSSVSLGESWFATMEPAPAPSRVVTVMHATRLPPRLGLPVDEHAAATSAARITAAVRTDRRIPLSPPMSRTAGRAAFADPLTRRSSWPATSGPDCGFLALDQRVRGPERALQRANGLGLLQLMCGRSA